MYGWVIWGLGEWGEATSWGRTMDLFEETTLLDNVGDCFHLYTLCFIDVLESVEVFGLLVLDNADLGEG